MKKKTTRRQVLLSFLGTTDPIRGERDGAMLHILRHYRPEVVCLLFTPEVRKLAEADERYEKVFFHLIVEATGFADDRIHEVTGHGSNASDISLYSTRKAAWAMMSFLTRVNYSFDDRYTLTGSFRADGSSRFGIDSRWGYFPSVSAGWTLSNEPFLKDALKDVASIRLRASWGKSGNNDIGNYASLAGISSGSYAFGQTPVSTTYEGSFTDAALGWETTRQTNVGIDLGFFNGRLRFA